MFSLDQVTAFLIYFPGVVFILAITLAIIGYRREPRRLLNSWFIVTGATILLGLPIILLTSLVDTHQLGWRLLGLLGYGALTLGLFDWLMLLSWHVSSWRHHLRLIGCLSIIIALLLAAIPFIPGSAWPHAWLTPLRYMNTALTLLGGYMVITIADFLVATWTYPRRQHLQGADYVIVLGSGLQHGDQLSKLLQSRIDVAIQAATTQHQHTHQWPVLIMSGGQGPDETVSEASAMAAYALGQGYPQTAIRREEKSTSTFENFQYALDEIHEGKPVIDFVTNNFHVFRAAIIAASLKLPSLGIGAPTGSNYYVRGLIREYAALTWLHKRRHEIALLLILILTIAIPWFYG